MENAGAKGVPYESTVFAVVSGLHFTPKHSTHKMSKDELRKFTDNQREKINNGFELIPNKLFLRYIRDEDIDKIKNSIISRMYGKLPNKNDVMLEFFHKEGVTPHHFTYPIEMTLLALRLFREEYVSIHKIAFIDNRNTGGGLEGDFEPLMGDNSLYYLTPDDIPPLKEIFEKLMKWDWEKPANYELACSRFGKSYDEKPVNKIIDLYIGLESLFCKKDVREKGKVIGIRCSELIGESESDKADIKEKLIRGYSLRNSIVHGSISETTAVYEIHPLIENYLRASLYQLIINEK